MQVNVEIMRTFVRLRRILAENAGLARRLDELEKKYDVQFKVVFDAVRGLMQPPAPKKKRIGFVTDDDKPGQTGSGSDFIARDRSRRRTRRQITRCSPPNNRQGRQERQGTGFLHSDF